MVGPDKNFHNPIIAPLSAFHRIGLSENSPLVNLSYTFIRSATTHGGAAGRKTVILTFCVAAIRSPIRFPHDEMTCYQRWAVRWTIIAPMRQ